MFQIMKSKEEKSKPDHVRNKDKNSVTGVRDERASSLPTPTSIRLYALSGWTQRCLHPRLGPQGHTHTP